MGLKWLNQKRNQLMKTEDSITNDTATPVLSRLIFIGFGKVSGFRSFEWKDWNWKNVADYDAVFICMASLYNLIHDWKEQYEADQESFAVEPLDKLTSNLDRLRDQILQVINSGRQVFVLATPDAYISVRLPNSSRLYARYVGVYNWCPLPVKVHHEHGEAIKDIDPNFSGFRQHVKEWRFYFDDKPRLIENFPTNELDAHQAYITDIKNLFVNLSLHPLAIELRYGILDRTDMPEYRIESISGPIYLLHHPIGGDIIVAVRELVRKFCHTDFSITEEPKWLEDIIPPNGQEIDTNIMRLNAQIEDLTAKRDTFLAQRRELEVWRKLLYETGSALENVVFEALQVLGLQNVRFGPKGDQDIVGELDGEIFLFEVKGLTKTAGRGEVFSLDRHITEFEAKNPGMRVAKGVLVANTYRELSPDIREQDGRQIFAGDAVKHAKLLKFALVDTRILYRMLSDTIEGRLDKGVLFLELLSVEGVYKRK